MLRNFVKYRVLDKIGLLYDRLKFRHSNCHNSLRMDNRFPIDCLISGKYSYGNIRIYTNTSIHKLYIGSFVSIGPNVSFFLDDEHHINTFSTFPFREKVLGQNVKEAFGKGDIIVEDDVWIGCGATIMSGVRISQGSVVAAGAVVTKDIPPYSVVGGVPARVIKYRFKQEIIEELMKVDYNKLSKELIKEHIGDLYEDITNSNQISWAPRKK